MKMHRLETPEGEVEIIGSYLHYIRVNPEHRGRGVGAFLISEIQRLSGCVLKSGTAASEEGLRLMHKCGLYDDPQARPQVYDGVVLHRK